MINNDHKINSDLIPVVSPKQNFKFDIMTLNEEMVVENKKHEENMGKKFEQQIIFVQQELIDKVIDAWKILV